MCKGLIKGSVGRNEDD